MLERLAGLLEVPAAPEAAGGSLCGGGSVVLLERGDTVAVPRHARFRLVAAMNPATDAGKHELPAGARPWGREDGLARSWAVRCTAMWQGTGLPARRKLWLSRAVGGCACFALPWAHKSW